MENAETEAREENTSLFPLFGVSAGVPQSTTAIIATSTSVPPPEWLCNTSFSTNHLSLVEEAVSSIQKDQTPTQLDEEEEDDPNQPKVPPPSAASYELDEEEDGYSNSDSDVEGKKKKRRKKKRSRDENVSRKSYVRVWADSHTKAPKDYFFDSHGDADNLAYGSLYRMDVPRHKSYNSSNLSVLNFRDSRRLKLSSVLDIDTDADALDVRVKSNGRYWSAKYAAVECQKSLKRLRLLAPKQRVSIVSDDFIPFIDEQISREDVDHCSISSASLVEESWEDELLRKTREFNQLTRERPHDEKVWLDFAEFQDKVANMQPRKGARLQILEKKISILEKAVELNPDNEELLLYLLKAYQNRDNTDVLIARWEKILMNHSGSSKLWKAFLDVVQGDFSRFKVSDMRKIYAHAIQALSSASSRQFRQVYQNSKPSSVDSSVVQLELGLVDVFLRLCRFEWQAGYQELATALFQAEIEFTLFCPSLLLSEQSKLRLFEHFWNSNGPRVGEEGALGWSSWLEKEEENRQRIMKEENLHDNEKGGWTGWSEPVSKLGKDKHPENVVNCDVTSEDSEDYENEDIKLKDNTEALLKQLGIDVDAGPSSEVNDTSTWIKWSEEESLRDSKQWMPIRGKSDGISQSVVTPEKEADEQFLGVILFEDVSEYMFSLSSGEARFSLISQFIEFFGVDMSKWTCTNNSSWTEKILSLEVLPDSIAHNLSLTGDGVVFLSGNTMDNSKRADVFKFVRNVILLCLTAFPRNHILEEAALVAEELSTPRIGSSTPCRALAKSLLKNDRQDLLLCGVYAKREAAFGNIDLARRVFDMALSSIEGLPMHLQSNAFLLCFWYAEVEIIDNNGNMQESPARALHILSCLGTGTKYHPFEHKPSNLQLLRAHQGFKEKLKVVQSAWTKGVIDDQSVALICSAALFEELATGWAAAIEVLDEVFTMILPDRRRNSYQLEFLFNFYVKMFLRHHRQSSSSKLWESILRGLHIYPYSSELLKALVEITHLYTTPSKVRWLFDDYCYRKPSVVVLIFALSFEMSRGGSQYRIHGLFERALAHESLRKSVILWRMYMAYKINIAQDPSASRRIFFRAIHACPWSKKLWLDGFTKLKSILSAKELSDLQEVMRDKELNLRTDIYEILLRDELMS